MILDPARFLKRDRSPDALPGPIRIVVADDNEAMRTAIAELLNAAEDLEVVGLAANVTKALQLVDSVAPDVVVTDVWMPGGGGVEVCKAIRQLARPPRVIAISASLIRGTREAVLNAGAAAFLLKDTADRDLVQLVREIVRERGTEPEFHLHENPVVAVRVVDRFGTIFGWDAGAEQLYGWTSGEVLGKKVGDGSFGPGTLDLTSEMMEHLSLGRTWEADFSDFKKDNSKFPAHAIYVPVLAFGVVQCVVVISYEAN